MVQRGLCKRDFHVSRKGKNTSWRQIYVTRHNQMRCLRSIALSRADINPDLICVEPDGLTAAYLSTGEQDSDCGVSFEQMRLCPCKQLHMLSFGT